MTSSKYLRFVIRSKSQPSKLWATFRDSEDALTFHRHMMDFPEGWEVADIDERSPAPSPSKLPGVLIVRVGDYAEIEPLETVARNLGLPYRWDIPMEPL